MKKEAMHSIKNMLLISAIILIFLYAFILALIGFNFLTGYTVKNVNFYTDKDTSYNLSIEIPEGKELKSLLISGEYHYYLNESPDVEVFLRANGENFLVVDDKSILESENKPIVGKAIDIIGKVIETQIETQKTKETLEEKGSEKSEESDIENVPETDETNTISKDSEITGINKEETNKEGDENGKVSEDTNKSNEKDKEDNKGQENKTSKASDENKNKVSDEVKNETEKTKEKIELENKTNLTNKTNITKPKIPKIEKEKEISIPFKKLCKETCKLPKGIKRNLSLVIKINSGKIVIEKIHYKFREIENETEINETNHSESKGNETKENESLINETFNESFVNGSYVNESMLKNIEVEKIKADNRYDVIMDNISFDNETRQLEILFHHNYKKLLKVFVNCENNNYELNKTEINEGERAKLIVYDWQNNSYCEIKVGESSEVIGIGKIPIYDFNLKVEDANKNVVNADIELYKEDNNKEKLVKKIKTDKKAKKGKYKVKIKPKNHHVKEISFDIDVNKSLTQLLKLDDVPKAELSRFVEIYAIDPSNLSSNLTIKAVAKGTELWKCKDWNFTERKCYGEWKKLKDIVPGQNYTFALTPEDPALAEANGSWFEGFESGSFTTNNWTLISAPGANNWTIATTDPYNGTYYAEARPRSTTEPASVMETTINTIGYQNVTFSYYRKLVGLDPADEFKVKWYNGTDWIIVEETLSNSANDPSYVFKTFNLPSSASNNPNFKIRFECTAGAASEYCRIDDIRITGISLNKAPQITLNLPTNNTQFNNIQDINFNFTATDDLNSTLSCSIYLDGTLNQTNNSVQNNTLTNFLITGISYGSHSWYINCSDGSLSNVSETRYFSIPEPGGNYDNCNSASIDWSKWNITTTPGDESDIYATGTGYYVLDSNDGAELTLHTKGKKENFTKFTVKAWLDEDLGNGRGWHFGIGTGALYAQTSCNANTGWVPSNGYFVCFYRNNGGTQIYRVDNGVETQIASNANNVPTDGYYNYTVELNSSGVFVFINDTLWINSSDTTYSQGYITISTGGGNTNRGNMSIDAVWYYEVDNPPNVTLIYPYDNYYNDTSKYINLTFNATVTDDHAIVNCSLWHNYTGIWHLNQTQNVTETSNVTNFTLNDLTNKTFIWNIQCYDNASQSDFGDVNRTVKLNWTAPPDNPPVTTLNSPPNNYYNDSASPINVTFNCSATDDIQLINISLYITNSTNQSFSLNQTTNISGTSNSSQWILSLNNGNYTWNCLAYDNASQSDWGDTNRSLKINYSAPVNQPPQITLNKPDNNTQFNNTQNINFNFTATDDQNSTLECSIYLDSVLNQTNSSTQNNTLTNFLINGISYGSHNWYINCTDGELSNVSETRYFSITDTIPPSIQFTSPTETSGTTINRNYIQVNVTASDSGTGLKNITTYLYNSSSLVNSTTSTSSPFFTNFTNLSEGTYYFNSTACDNAGNCNSTETRNVTIFFNKAPQITLNKPDNDTNFNDTQNINFNFTATDDQNTILSCSIYLDGTLNQTNNSVQNNTLTNFLITGISYGSHNWYINCSDGSLSNVSETRTFSIVDTVPPTYTNDQDDSSGTVVEGTIVNVSVLWQDTVGLDTAVFRTNETGTWTNVSTCSLSGTSGWCNKTIDTTGDAGKTICWNQYANDTSGNWNTSMPETAHCFSVTAANVAPQITLNKPDNSTQFNNTQDINFNFTATDDQNTTLLCSIYLDSVLNQTNNSVQNNTLTNFLIQGIPYGSHNWYINCSDGSLNNVSEMRQFTISDTIPPVIQFVPPTETSGSIISRNYIQLNVTASDSGTGLKNITTYLYNSSSLVNSTTSTSSPFFTNFTNLSEGTYYFNSTACDNAGNCNSTETRNVTIFFNKAPQITLNLPANNTQFNNIQDINFNFTATDDLSSTLSCSIYLDGTLNQTNNSVQNNTLTNFLIQGISYGNHSWYIYCSDGELSNVSETRYFSITDTIPPVIQFVNPTEENGSYLARSYVLINASAIDNESKIKNITIYLYNETSLIANTSCNAPICFANFTGLDDGKYYFNATVYDNYGNYNKTETRRLVIDMIKPIILIYSPKNTTYSTNTVYLNYTAEDNNLDSCWYKINNTNISLPNCQNITLNLTEGSYVLIIYANDTAGNTNSTNVTFAIDTTSPSISFASPTTQSGNYSQSYIIANVTVSDAHLDTITIYLYNSSGLVNFSLSHNSSLLVNFTNLPDGIYYLNATANDTAGNLNQTETRIITLDTTPPNITNITITTTTNNALIEWKTNELANASIAYGTNLSLINNKSNSSFVFNHSIFLDGLNQNTLYYFNITSCDIVGNCKTEGIYNFTTKKVSEKHGGEHGGEKEQEMQEENISIEKPEIEKEIKICNVTKEFKENNFAICLLKENEIMIFEINNQTHKIIIEKINENYIDILIYSSPLKIRLYKGITTKIDINNDSKEDIYVTFLGIDNSEVKIKIESVKERREQILLKEKQPSLIEKIKSRIKNNLIGLIIIFAFIILILLIALTRKRERKENLEEKIRAIEGKLREEGYEWKIKRILKE